MRVCACVLIPTPLQVYDLLNPASGVLGVRWNSKRGFYVQDLFVVDCEDLSDVMAVVSEGACAAGPPPNPAHTHGRSRGACAWVRVRARRSPQP